MCCEKRKESWQATTGRKYTNQQMPYLEAEQAQHTRVSRVLFFQEQSRQLCIKFASQLNNKTFCFHECHRYNKLFAKIAPVCKKII